MTGIAPPEPDLTPAEAIARARALRPPLRERSAETEARTYYSEETHRDLLDAGLYRLLVPRRYGGYEFDVPTFLRVVMELAQGDASAGWCYCLAAGHALQAGALFEERAQAELFGDGDFRAPAVAAPAGTATRTADGWEISGTYAYCSGAPYATHYLGQTFAPGAEPGGPPGPILLFAAPRDQWTMLDDWGVTLGLKGSGSHSIRLDRARLPSHLVLENAWLVDTDVSNGTPGLRLHGNPMYAGRTLSFFQAELSSIVTGAVKGALVDYEELLRSRKTQRPPIVPRYQDPDYQRWFGLAIGRVATAEAALIQLGEQYMELCERSASGGEPFSREDDLRLNIVAREALALAWSAMSDLIYKTAGSGAARNGERLERVFRDVSMGWGHFGNVVGDWAGRELAREHFGVVAGGPAKPDQDYKV